MIISGFTSSQNLTSNSTGSFIFNPESPIDRPSVEVFYHIPSGDLSSMPILFSFHGAGRNGNDYRDFWIEMANQNGFMVFAPEFSSSNYPGLGDNYLMGNIFDDGDNPEESEYNLPEEWTFSVIEPLFNYIKTDISGTQQTYDGWGHSGGAQFLHRFTMFVPQSSLGTAVCSNAGWYTVPENEIHYPYGNSLPFGSDNNIFDFLQSTSNGLNVNIEQFFSKKLIVHLGTNDTDPNSSGLRHNDVVDNQQGLNRYVRGNYFFNTGQAYAQDLNTPFNWEQHDVLGANHQGQVMANDALQFFLNNDNDSGDEECIGSSDLYTSGANANFPYVFSACSIGDGNNGSQQTLEINITSLPNGGANYRIGKTVANGNWNFGSAQPLSIGYNLLNVDAVAFDRAVRFQFSSSNICYDSFILNGTELAVLGLEDFNMVGKLIFPNPVKDILSISGIENIISIKVYSIKGKLEKEVINNDQVDFSNLSSGIYLIKVDNGNTYLKRVIKK